MVGRNSPRIGPGRWPANSGRWRGAWPGQAARVRVPWSSCLPACGLGVPSGSASVELDESQPTIQLRVQLGDGSRLPARFNATHTIGDVYAFVDRARPEGGGGGCTRDRSALPVLHAPHASSSINVPFACTWLCHSCHCHWAKCTCISEALHLVKTHSQEQGRQRSSLHLHVEQLLLLFH